MRIILFGLITYWVYQNFLKEPKEKIMVDLPAGLKATGRVQRTTDTVPPGWPIETVGFAIRDFVEVQAADGSKKWIEVSKVKK